MTAAGGAYVSSGISLQTASKSCGTVTASQLISSQLRAVDAAGKFASSLLLNNDSTLLKSNNDPVAPRNTMIAPSTTTSNGLTVLTTNETPLSGDSNKLLLSPYSPGDATGTALASIIVPQNSPCHKAARSYGNGSGSSLFGSTGHMGSLEYYGTTMLQ